CEHQGSFDRIRHLARARLILRVHPSGHPGTGRAQCVFGLRARDGDRADNRVSERAHGAPHPHDAAARRAAARAHAADVCDLCDPVARHGDRGRSWHGLPPMTAPRPQPTTAAVPQPAAASSSRVVLEACDIVKELGHGAGKVRALKGVSLTLTAGELTLLMGPSGSGQTTLLSILGCILTPTEGPLSIAGEPPADLSPEGLAALRRRHVGFIFQSYNLFPTLTAEENVRVALDVRGRRGSAATVAAQRALQQVGLRHKLKAFPGNMSGGEQQRVAVARALAGSPSVMLADEPTAALDSDNAIRVMQLLAEIARDKSRAVLAVTHDPRTVPFANRVLRIEDGLIIGEERRTEGIETVHELARNRKRKANA